MHTLIVIDLALALRSYEFVERSIDAETAKTEFERVPTNNVENQVKLTKSHTKNELNLEPNEKKTGAQSQG